MQHGVSWMNVHVGEYEVESIGFSLLKTILKIRWFSSLIHLMGSFLKSDLSVPTPILLDIEDDHSHRSNHTII
jgi:hypothetical protein